MIIFHSVKSRSTEVKRGMGRSVARLRDLYDRFTPAWSSKLNREGMFFFFFFFFLSTRDIHVIYKRKNAICSKNLEINLEINIGCVVKRVKII